MILKNGLSAPPEAKREEKRETLFNHVPVPTLQGFGR
jgi:hypothetical protein